MNYITILLGALILIGIIMVFINTRRKPESGAERDFHEKMIRLEERIGQLNEKSTELTRVLDSKMAESTQAFREHIGATNKIVRDVTERLTKLDETNKQVLNFSDQLQKLQDTLNNPKQRGVFGEYYLDTLLSKVFQPNQYKMQYKFKDGVIVDAVLFFADKIIPIDSKFSLENYNRIVEEQNSTERERLEKLFKQDLRNRIDETAKYVRPEEGTTDFAFMFIPAEGIYYDLLVNKVGALKVNTRDLLDYAIREKKVHIVSPTTFYVTLQSLIIGMRAFTIQESTKQIIKNVSVLTKHLRAYQEYFSGIGPKLGNTVSAYNKASDELRKINTDVYKIAGEDIGFEQQLLEKPKEE